MKLLILILVVSFLSAISFGQTASDFEKKYGAEKYYKIRPYSVISPVFDKNGNMCRALIEPNRNVKQMFRVRFPKPDVVFLTSDKERRFPIPVLNLKELKEIFDELVPVESRKGKGTVVPNGIERVGFAYLKGLQFENVEINVASISTSGGVIDATEESPNTFFSPFFSSYKQAVIVWKDRACAEKSKR